MWSGLCKQPASCLSRLHRRKSPDSPNAAAQTIVPWSYEGGVARLTCNGVSLNAKGEWLLPYWRELGGPSVCQNKPSLHGTAGVLITGDQVGRP